MSHSAALHPCRHESSRLPNTKYMPAQLADVHCTLKTSRTPREARHCLTQPRFLEVQHKCRGLNDKKARQQREVFYTVEKLRLNCSGFE